MQRSTSILKGVLTALSVIFLLACSESDDASAVASDQEYFYTSSNSAPRIIDIEPVVIHRHVDSGFVNYYGSASPTIVPRLWFKVDAPKGLDSVSKIFLKATNWDETYLIFGREESAWYECSIDEEGNAYCQFAWWAVDAQSLDGWELTIEDSDGAYSTQSFSYYLPGEPVKPSRGEVVYSTAWRGVIYEPVVPALEAMTIQNNNIKLEANESSQTFDIEFEHREIRAAGFGIDFIIETGDMTYAIWHWPYDSALRFGSQTRINVDWADLEFPAGYQATDVTGMEVWLHDQWDEDLYTGQNLGHWGVSEYVPVTPNR